MENVKTMYELEVNEFGEEITIEYLIPITAIKKYLETDNNDKVNTFLESEYTSEDTNNIIRLCIRSGIEFDIVREELTGQYL